MPKKPANSVSPSKNTVPSDSLPAKAPVQEVLPQPSQPSDQPFMPDSPFTPSAKPLRAGQVVGVEKMPAGEIVQGLSKLAENPKNLTLAQLLKLKSQGVGGFNNLYELPNNRPLTQSELDFMNRDFAVARAAGMPMITRFSYTQVAGGSDASAAMIKTHLQQLAPILRANEDMIGAMELGFVGAWGEWNRSTNGNDKNFGLAKDIYNNLSAALPNTPIAFRTAWLVRNIFGDNPPNNVILHNDSIGQKLGAPMQNNDGGSYQHPGDYQYTIDHHMMTIGENNGASNPNEILKRIKDANITSMHFWGAPAREIKASSALYKQIIDALKANAAKDGIQGSP